MGGCEVVRVAGTEEDEAIIRVPRVVGPAIVRVQPELIVVRIHIEDVRTAVAVAMYSAPSVPPPLEDLCRSQG